MNNSCTSQITLHHLDGKFIACWQKIHYGHGKELQHIRLTKNQRLSVASKLISGVRPTKILESARNDIGEHSKRLQLLTSSDIRNIKSSFKIDVEDGKRHENDAVSVDMWVQECRSQVDNEVLFYKKQGEQVENLEVTDFCLVVMNEFQKKMCRDFGHNIIAIDGTHGLNGYDFELTTLMVIDEFHQGFPVAFMFANRKNTQMYTHFFNVIKLAIGHLQPKTFMSDLEETFYNSWTTIMGPVEHTLYCSWHVDRAWQSNLNKIRVVEKRENAYKMLKALQQHSKIESFDSSLHNLISFFLQDKDTESFGKYFQTHYMHNFKKWAYCFRVGCGINTNTHLESMHKTIKYFYLERKSVKRLDKGLDVILKYRKDKCVERIIKLTKGKITKRDKETLKRHNNAVSESYIMQNLSTGVIEVKSSESLYTVKREAIEKCCSIVCNECNICIHMFSCTCPDYRNNNICKHIHFVMINTDSSSPEVNVSSSPEVNVSSSPEANVSSSPEVNVIPPINKSPVDDWVSCVSRQKNLGNILENTVENIRAMDISKLDSSIVNQICYHLSVINNLSQIPSLNCEILPSTSKSDSNKRVIDPQLRFHSTKKKNKDKKAIFKTPTTTELSNITNFLTTDLFVSTCPSNDHKYC